MRKLAVLMGLVLVMGVAVPAAAGINTDITGSLNTQVYYDQHYGLWAWGKVTTEVTMSTGTDGAIKAVIGLGSSKAEKEGNFGDPGDGPLKKTEGIALKVNTAYVEANGAWIEGTPDVTTKIGRFGTNYSDWVANIGDRDGVELSNIELGPVSVAALYAWVNDGPISSDYLWRKEPYASIADEDARQTAINTFIEGHKGLDWRIVAVRGSGNLDVVDLNGVFVRTFADDDEDQSLTDYAVTASVTPIDGVKLDATFAGTNYEGVLNEQGTAYRVGAELSTIPNLTLGASLWSSDDEFNPIYAKLDDKKPVAFPGWDKANERKGFEVKADTTQAGFDLGVTVKNTSDADGSDASKATSYEFRASRDFNGIKGSYKYEDGDNKVWLHTVTVETTVDTPIASGVNLKGTLRLHEEEEFQYAADATWTAPNGINLGLHYANYDREDGWGGRDVGPKGEADGFVVRASYEISW